MTITEKLDAMRASERKNAETLAAYRGASWKQKQIHGLKFRYGRLAEQWGKQIHGDDRDVYCRTYQMMLNGLQSLSANPGLYIRVAVGEKLRTDRAMLDRIAGTFGENAMGQEARG